MCLAIPGKIQEINDDMAQINFDGILREASLQLVPKAKIGDYVFVHAGYAIEIVNEQEAKKTIELLKEIN